MTGSIIAGTDFSRRDSTQTLSDPELVNGLADEPGGVDVLHPGSPPGFPSALDALMAEPDAAQRLLGDDSAVLLQPDETQGTTTYQVQRGDNLTSIARNHGVELPVLLAANSQITNPDRIFVGQLINIPSNTVPEPQLPTEPVDSVDEDTVLPPAVLARGSRGSDVEKLQRNLVDIGFMSQADMNTGPGIYGPRTEAAVRRFQSRMDVAVTGRFDTATQTAMASIISGDATLPPAASGGVNDLELSESIHERRTPARQYITSPVIGDFIITEGYMARGGPHSSKGAARAIFADNPEVAETVRAGVYNLGIDYVTQNGRIQSWFDGEVLEIRTSGGYGNRLIMRADQTFNYQGQEYPVFAHYAHADEFDVVSGNRVSAGQDIGDQGSTGHSTGDHVDFLTWIETDRGRIYISPNLLSGQAV